MMNHMEEIQELMQLFQKMPAAAGQTEPAAPFSPSVLSGMMQKNSGSMFSEISSMLKMMEGSDLDDEFTYVEEPSGIKQDGSEKGIFTDKGF